MAPFYHAKERQAMKAIANLPAPLRHLILVVLSAAVGVISGEQTDVGAATTPVVTAAVAYALAALTPLVQSWGLGRKLGASTIPFDGPFNIIEHVTLTNGPKDPKGEK